MRVILLIILAILFNPTSCRQKSTTPSNKSSNVATSPTAPGASSPADVMIDFERCTPSGRINIPVALGSTTYEVIGKSRNGCVMKYGGEVENPSWDGFLDKTCVIPFSLGQRRFGQTQIGVDFSSLEPYCKKVSQTGG